MSPLWGHLAGVLILLMMLIFIGIWIWAWQASNQRLFNRMAQLPMQDGQNAEAGGQENHS